MIRFALVLALLLSAGGAWASEPVDPFERQIALGRLSAMVGAAETVMGQAADDGEDAAAQYARLYRTSLDLEVLRARACGSGRISGKVCRQRYAPKWLRPPGSFNPTLEQVWRWTDLLQGEVMDVTAAVCATAPPDPEGPGACSVE
ncbi:hypothetical protein [Caulobacter sp. NIBR1757]|uniref:hypothetical protein n=1 Tax=Caulobacter sp. NIBR1757 TaxID=3016000 RepID=UPI0022EFF657|nr:hypothetical protein [Caulobacter sp. NIBR1757]WGM39814.1 hypothetical protein AMEJIAPC_02742 [Caulobacter sp. NIBR1757]